MHIVIYTFWMCSVQNYVPQCSQLVHERRECYRRDLGPSILWFLPKYAAFLTFSDDYCSLFLNILAMAAVLGKYDTY
jgi:hypothetical protein